jgi:hypothetical protein
LLSAFCVLRLEKQKRSNWKSIRDYMYVCVCVCMCACMYVCVCVCMCACMYACVCACACTYLVLLFCLSRTPFSKMLTQEHLIASLDYMLYFNFLAAWRRKNVPVEETINHHRPL